MTPFLQTKHCPEERGNCLATSIGCILDIPVSEIPEFEEMPKKEWRHALNSWLHNKGFALDTLQSPPDGFAIAVGWTSAGGLHAVVVKDGEFFHDPDPAANFLVNVRNYWHLRKINNAF